MMLLETLAGGEVEIALHLVHLQVTVHLASLLLLGLHLGRPPLPVALFYPLGGIEGPAFLSISFSYIFTCIAASTEIEPWIKGKIWNLKDRDHGSHLQYCWVKDSRFVLSDVVVAPQKRINAILSFLKIFMDCLIFNKKIILMMKMC